MLELILLGPNYFILKTICLPIGPMMVFPLFPLVWNARSKLACSSDKYFPQQFPNMEHIWGLFSARASNSPFLSLHGYLHLKLVCTIFIRFLFFDQLIALQKLLKVGSKKLFSFSRYSVFAIFSLPFHTFQIQKDYWKWNNLWCHELACINLQM